MADWFVPEADRLEQEQQVEPEPGDEEEPFGQGEAILHSGALPKPPRLPLEAPEADVLEQSQEVVEDDDDWR